MRILERLLGGGKDLCVNIPLSFLGGCYSHGFTSIVSSFGDCSREDKYNPFNPLKTCVLDDK